MTDELTTTGFEERAARGLAQPFLRRAIPNATDHAVEALVARFADADREALRDLGRDIRAHTVAHLAELAGGFADAAERVGSVVHFAADAAEARAIVTSICVAAGARSVVKAKSMLSEEVELNGALDRAGIDVVETDLGERVVQLSDDRPSHVIAPIIHRTRDEVRQILERDAGRPLGNDPATLTAYAREALREAFLAADVGITGANFAVVESGQLCLVSNEGNARLAVTLPRVHIALVGIERLVPRLADLAVLLPLLVGSATGQRLSTYVSLVAGPRAPGEPDGPDEQHVVLIDNGRSAIAATEYAEILHCIRCGACQNVCPVYRQVGGHAYGWVYGGPIGAVLTPLLRGLEDGGELAQATSLCGACDDVCPVRIPLHELLRRLRVDRAAAGGGRAERWAFAIWSVLWSRAGSYRGTIAIGKVALRVGGRWRRAPGLLGRFTRGRDLPRARRR